MADIAGVLAVDDDPDVLHAVRLALASKVQTLSLASSTDGLEQRLTPDLEVVLLDMNFLPGDQSGREGLGALERVTRHDKTLSVVLMTAYGGVSLAVDALKRGASDFVLKPWRNDKLVQAVESAAKQSRARRLADRTLDLDTIERKTIEQALTRFGGNVSQAAAALGLTRPALYRRMSKYGL